MRIFLSFFVFVMLLSCTNDDSVTPADLNTQMRQINALIENEVCIDAADWRFAPLGSKPCGGPTGYIAYSIKIDTVSFLRKVEVFNELQRQYNIDNDIISNCAIEPMPLAVQCENGLPILIYSACDLLPKEGPCEALIPKYYFDKEAQECRVFSWGGCDGVVPFDTLEECEICQNNTAG